ncbi:phosphoribosyltransferase [Chlorogloeopsis fritschii PCC 9212]|uniref:Phosphoribosyl transferase n=1 Tax=Chlorogloeopsis fritschii PCC 6912 TaxID=211165 RepID=A0A3S0XJK5_CHLFR|nr:phosphoribosyltransferase family protein [Chlorogloeopsis fritschii]RUR74197.1 phosphoribosyl transferase [Chlorogloeopsis fritschii PCC 6912]
MLYKNRTAAGQFLAKELAAYANRPDVLVLALPRGGVPVAFEVAKALNAPLDVFVVRKLGVPDQPELAMGAIASGGVRVLNQDIVRSLRLTETEISREEAKQRQELERRERLYRGNRPFPVIRGRTVIVVDDGLATGATMRAAIMALLTQQPARLVVAVPVAAPQTCQELESEVDEVVCAVTPTPFYSVGLWYENFPQTSDEEVRSLLEKAAKRDRESAIHV